VEPQGRRRRGVPVMLMVAGLCGTALLVVAAVVVVVDPEGRQWRTAWLTTSLSAVVILAAILVSGPSAP
jgi:hypothetical protein